MTYGKKDPSLDLLGTLMVKCVAVYYSLGKIYSPTFYFIIRKELNLISACELFECVCVKRFFNNVVLP